MAHQLRKQETKVVECRTHDSKTRRGKRVMCTGSHLTASVPVLEVIEGILFYEIQYKVSF